MAQSTQVDNSLYNAPEAAQAATRRVALLGATLAPLLAAVAGPLSRPARAAVVDEEIAEAVYSAASKSVAALAIVRRDPSGGETVEGSGSGVVWDTYGHILTNYHCIGGVVSDKSASKYVRIEVSGRRYDAAVVATDAQHDLAVLQLQPEEGDEGSVATLRPIAVGTSADLKIGQSLFAIGNPYGLSGTLSAGLVSGLNRAIPSPVGGRIYGVIQTDASINAGNSGGALLDGCGRLVGLNTATFTKAKSGRGSGVNFALPADMLRELVPNLIVYRTASGKGLGIAPGASRHL